ncbi:MAG: glycosyltransferase family 2 protein [Dethiobacteraceae bacterium]
MPKISIIVPVYNVENYINKCIESLIAQTLSDIEIILVNDGSTDKSGNICNDYAAVDNRIIVIHQMNKGVSAARNKGIEAATGEWITFVDADDWVDSSMCELVYGYAKKYDVDLVMWNHYWNYPEKEVLTTMFEEEIKFFQKDQIQDIQRIIIESYSSNGNLVSNATFVWCKLWNREIINRLSDYWFNINLKWGEDQDFNLRLLEKTSKIIFINKNLYHYRINMNSVTNAFNLNRIDLFNSYLSELEKFVVYLKKDDKIFLSAFYKRVIYTLILLVSLHFCHPDNKEGLLIRVKDLKKLINSEPYKTALQNVDMSDQKMERQIFVYAAKKQLCFGIILLGYVKRTFNYLSKLLKPKRVEEM